MSEPVSLKDHDWRNKPTRTGGLRCGNCGAGFIGVWPDSRSVVTLNCPRCKALMLDEAASEVAYKLPWMAVYGPKGMPKVKDIGKEADDAT